MNLKTEVTRQQSTPNFLKSEYFLPLIRTRGGKKGSFFGKLGMFCFLVTYVLRFALLPYHWRLKRCSYIARTTLNISACNFIKKETLAQVFFCEFCGIFKNTYLTEQLRTTTSRKFLIPIFLISVSSFFTNINLYLKMRFNHCLAEKSF